MKRLTLFAALLLAAPAHAQVWDWIPELPKIVRHEDGTISVVTHFVKAAPVSTLATLAGADAPRLSAAYTEVKAGLPNFGTATIFRNATTIFLTSRGLAANPAVPEITKRIDAVLPLAADLDAALQAKLAAVLDGVVKELGAPTPPDPTPTPVPTPSGKKNIVILREVGDETPASARLVIGLRNGESAAYLKSKGHKLAILDDESRDESGQPSPYVAKLLAAGVTVPSVVVLNQETGAVEHHEQLNADATAASVLAIVKAHGG